MSLRKLPEIKNFTRPDAFQWDAPSDVLAKWAQHPHAASDDGKDNTVTIYDVIGEDWWSGGGFTAKRMAAALRSISKNDVTVNINSPGGDMFEGIAIYNMLREHEAKVTINVMGWAASAASIIAMAGDEIRVGLGSFIMVHNAWGGVVGNRHDLASAAKVFEGFDAGIADIYEARTGLKREEIVNLMDDETFLPPSEAVKLGFADAIASDIEAPTASNDASGQEIHSKRKMDALLAQAGVPRSERRRMFKDLSGTHNATDPATHDAGFDMAAAQRLIETLR